MSVSAPHPIRLQRTSLSFPPTNSHYYNSQQASRSAAKGAGPSGMLGIVVSEPEHSFLLLGIPTWKTVMRCYSRLSSFAVGAKRVRGFRPSALWYALHRCHGTSLRPLSTPVPLTARAPSGRETRSAQAHQPAPRRAGLEGGTSARGSWPPGRARRHAKAVTWGAEDRSARGRGGWCGVESVVRPRAADPAGGPVARPQSGRRRGFGSCELAPS